HLLRRCLHLSGWGRLEHAAELSDVGAPSNVSSAQFFSKLQPRLHFACGVRALPRYEEAHNLRLLRFHNAPLHFHRALHKRQVRPDSALGLVLRRLGAADRAALYTLNEKSAVAQLLPRIGRRERHLPVAFEADHGKFLPKYNCDEENNKEQTPGAIVPRGFESFLGGNRVAHSSAMTDNT